MVVVLALMAAGSATDRPAGCVLLVLRDAGGDARGRRVRRRARRARRPRPGGALLHGRRDRRRPDRRRRPLRRDAASPGRGGSGGCSSGAPTRRPRLERHARVLEQERELRAARRSRRSARGSPRAARHRRHGVSTMVLQVGGVRRRLTPDQKAELDALLNVEETGRRSLAEMHRMLGMMRQSDTATCSRRSRAWRASRAGRVHAGGRPAGRADREGEPADLPSGLTCRRPDHPGGAHQHAEARRARRARG